MKELIRNFRSQSRGPIIGLTLIWVAYVVASLLAPTIDTQARFGISAVQANLLKLTVFLPYLFIWMAALLAVLSFRSYAPLVATSPESKGFHRIYRGLIFLFLAVFVPPLLGLIRTFNPHTEEVVKVMTIANYWISILFYLMAFWNLLRGSHDLLKTLQVTAPTNRTRLYTLVVLGLLSLAYVWSVFHNPTRTVSTDALIRPTYYLPDALIVLTIILPYILIWVWGSLAIINIRLFANVVSGQIYRQAFRIIAWGLTVITALTIGVQFLPQAGRYFARAELGIILLVVYLLLIIIAVGYILVARGASRLTAIEKV